MCVMCVCVYMCAYMHRSDRARGSQDLCADAVTGSCESPDISAEPELGRTFCKTTKCHLSHRYRASTLLLETVSHWNLPL